MYKYKCSDFHCVKKQNEWKCTWCRELQPSEQFAMVHNVEKTTKLCPDCYFN